LAASVTFSTPALLTVMAFAIAVPSGRTTATLNSAAASRIEASFSPARFGSA
jgi:hypothetical protein